MGEDKAERPLLLSVIVPTRNEAGNVRPLLAALAGAIGETPAEVIFVDDSTDETAAVVRGAMADFPFQVRLVARPVEVRNGLSGAVVDGLRAAGGRWVCVMDADLQHPPGLIPQLLRRATETGADVVVGSRLAGLGGPIGLSRLRSLTSQTLTLLARALFPRLLSNVSDPLTGLFLVRREAVDTGLLRPDGFKILLEILARCPDLRVSEIHFEFGPRHAGESKADFHEGIRFFRHLIRLRLTANQRVSRFLLVGILGIVINSLLLATLTEMGRLSYLLSAALATQGSTVWNFFFTEWWVFPERRQNRPAGHRLARFLLMNNGLLLLHLPLMFWLVERWGWHYLAANLTAIFVTTLVRYILSDRWIWTTGLIGRRPDLYAYDIHGLVRLESMVRLPALEAFLVGEPPGQVDIRLLVDRHGTPRCLPGAFCYDEGLGRFGFGVTALTGGYAEATVSPLLRHAPQMLYRYVVEPLIEQALAGKGYAPVAAACLAEQESGEATLIIGVDRSPAAFLVAAAQNGRVILASERTLLGEDGRVWFYPALLVASGGIWRWLGRLGLPALSLEMMGEIVRPPRYPAHEWIARHEWAGPAVFREVVLLSPDEVATRLSWEEAAKMLLGVGEGTAGFLLIKPPDNRPVIICKGLQVGLAKHPLP
jgi:glycosyltransferase involved in cell wall biosynthesis